MRTERGGRKQARRLVARIKHKENRDAGKPGNNKREGNIGPRLDSRCGNRGDAKRKTGERKGRKIAWALTCGWTFRLVAQKRDTGDGENHSSGGEEQEGPAP